MSIPKWVVPRDIHGVQIYCIILPLSNSSVLFQSIGVFSRIPRDIIVSPGCCFANNFAEFFPEWLKACFFRWIRKYKIMDYWPNTFEPGRDSYKNIITAILAHQRPALGKFWLWLICLKSPRESIFPMKL